MPGVEGRKKGDEMLSPGEVGRKWVERRGLVRHQLGHQCEGRKKKDVVVVTAELPPKWAWATQGHRGHFNSLFTLLHAAQLPPLETRGAGGQATCGYTTWRACGPQEWVGWGGKVGANPWLRLPVPRSWFGGGSNGVVRPGLLVICLAFVSFCGGGRQKLMSRISQLCMCCGLVPWHTSWNARQ